MSASYLLPDPGGEVVRSLIDEIDLQETTLKQAVAAEREACAKICDAFAALEADGGVDHGIAEWIAKEIRARGGEK